MMKRRTLLAVVSSILALAVIAGGWFALWLRSEASLEFTVRDAVSGKWVWGLEARLQDHKLVGFYQSDAAPAPLRFTGLRPTTATLTLAAEGYQSVTLQVALHRGRNRLATPVDMIGLEIPGLAGFRVYESFVGQDIVAEIRPVGADGSAVINHPCLDLWIGCRIFVQLHNGVPASEAATEGAQRGRELYRHQLSWTWDASPETLFRYGARIPTEAMQSDPSPYRVVDYLIVVPDPTRISRTELDEIMSRAYAFSDNRALAAALDAEGGRLRYFFDTSWNVATRQE